LQDVFLLAVDCGDADNRTRPPVVVLALSPVDRDVIDLAAVVGSIRLAPRPPDKDR
jgi:hypothetical protein